MLSCNMSKRSLSKPWGTTKQKDLQQQRKLNFYSRFILKVLHFYYKTMTNSLFKKKLKSKLVYHTFCSGGPISFDFLFRMSWLSVALLSLTSEFLENEELSLFHLLNCFFLVKAESDFWRWLGVECRFKADNTSSVVLLISDPKTEASHCLSHNRTCKQHLETSSTDSWFI